jgi:hypothetical protein
MQIQLSLAEIQRHDVELILKPDPEFADEYATRVSQGRQAAQFRSVAFVAICRNAMPFLPMTLARVEAAASMFKQSWTFIFENDSTDETKDFLSHWKTSGPERFVEMRNNGRPHLNFTKAHERTHALAEYRNQCRLWVASKTSADYVVVFDTDPWGGFSVDGIANTIGHMEDGEYSNASAMASYSWCQWGQPVWPQPTECQYDAWAARWTWWQERQNMIWFHLWHPPVGSPPVKFNSAFGQLAVYRAKDYIGGMYEGGDCEHVSFHKSLGGDLYVNPSSRVVSFWIPEHERQEAEGRRMHGDVHENVAGRDADPNHRRDAEDIGGPV